MSVYRTKDVDVDIEDDHVTIYGYGQEIVHWVDEEWTEDHTLAPIIANAVARALTEDVHEFAARIKKVWDGGEWIIDRGEMK